MRDIEKAIYTSLVTAYVRSLQLLPKLGNISTILRGSSTKDLNILVTFNCYIYTL